MISLSLSQQKQSQRVARKSEVANFAKVVLSPRKFFKPIDKQPFWKTSNASHRRDWQSPKSRLTSIVLAFFTSKSKKIQPTEFVEIKGALNTGGSNLNWMENKRHGILPLQLRAEKFCFSHSVLTSFRSFLSLLSQFCEQSGGPYRLMVPHHESRQDN